MQRRNTYSLRMYDYELETFKELAQSYNMTAGWFARMALRYYKPTEEDKRHSWDEELQKVKEAKENGTYA